MMERVRRIRALPIYPALFASAWIVGIFSASAASVYALPRPIAVAIVVAVALEVACSVLVRNVHLGALLTVVIGFALFGQAALALAVAVLVLLIVVANVRRGRSMSKAPWDKPTPIFNVIGSVTVVIALASAAFAGALTPSDAGIDKSAAAAHANLPDIYLILLDGHPRADTLATDFGFDAEPFLTEMSSLGFHVSRQSHSNYNVTALTLASMLNMRQVHDLPQVAPPPESPTAQYRALSRAINQGTGLGALRAQGFEIIAIPSQVTDVALYSADRVLDSGQMTDLEYDLMQAGTLRRILPDVQRPWLLGQHRERVEATFERLGDLAAERVDRPRFIFAHVMSPHVPIVFGPNGEPASGWPCFPADCTIFYGGQTYGDDIIAPTRDQVAYVDRIVADTARVILSRSAAPPVVIVMSDHGGRHDFFDPDEMLRSLFLAYSPDRPGLFPDDMTPINLLPRILNTYADADLPLATEESYLVDLGRLQDTGPLSFVPWEVTDAR